MAGVQGSAMAVAVSNAGGLGSLPCAMLTPDTLRSELQAITAQTTRPYNVNFFCHTPPVPDAAREAAWRATLAPYYAELGIDPAAPIPASNTTRLIGWLEAVFMRLLLSGWGCAVRVREQGWTRRGPGWWSCRCRW